jgi:hypothetical protein
MYDKHNILVYLSIGPPHGSPQFVASRCRSLDRRTGWLFGSTAVGSSHCWRHQAETGVGLQAVHRDDLLPRAHLDGEGLRPCGHHLVWAII